MIHLKIICTVLTALTLSACIRTQLSDRNFSYHTWQPIDASAVAIGISMKQVAPFFGPSRIGRVYFVVFRYDKPNAFGLRHRYL